MPININDPKKYKNDIKIDYNYSSIPIYINQFENNIQNGGFIKIPYISNSNDPNVITTYNGQSTQYKTNALYIINSQHLIKDISYSAELIVENKSTTNNSILYTCFLLDSSNNLNKFTNIDELIMDASNNGNNSPTTKKISLKNLIDNNNKNKTIYYKPDANSKVIILTNPYQIQTVFDASLVSLIPPLFNIVPTEYKIIESFEGFQNENQNENENIIEGFTKNMYCQPVDMTDLSGGSITTEPELSIPLDGNYIKNASTNTIIKTAINFMSFVLVLALSYLIVPMLYNDYVIGLIDITNVRMKMNRIRSIDIYICVVFILITFGLISRGITENSQTSTVIGFFLGLFFVISFMIIQSQKITVDWLRNTFNNIEPALISSYYTNVSVSEDFFNFVYENFTVLYSPFTNLFLLLFVYSISVLFLGMIGFFKDNGIMTSGNGHLYVFLFSIYITIALNTIISKQSKK